MKVIIASVRQDMQLWPTLIHGDRFEYEHIC